MGDHKQVLSEPCSELSALISGPEKVNFLSLSFFFLFSDHLSPPGEVFKPVPTSLWATRVLKIKPATKSVQHLPLSIPHISIDNASCSKSSSRPGKTCSSFCRLRPTRGADMSEMYDARTVLHWRSTNLFSLNIHIDNKQLGCKHIFQF